MFDFVIQNCYLYDRWLFLASKLIYFNQVNQIYSRYLPFIAHSIGKVTSYQSMFIFYYRYDWTGTNIASEYAQKSYET